VRGQEAGIGLTGELDVVGSLWLHGWNGGTKNASLHGKPREKAGKRSGTMLGWIQTIHCKKELKR
jgi:hypothetical protein